MLDPVTEKLPEGNIPASPPKKDKIKGGEKMRGETEMKKVGTDGD